jgi:hypothetical protein
MAEAAGFDLIWFGVLTVVAVEIGLLTPPFGLSVYIDQVGDGRPRSQGRRDLPRDAALRRRHAYIDRSHHRLSANRHMAGAFLIR